ncbi:gluconate 2-dehydrogenase subunit 3 family protein [Sphingobium sp. BYY-5]|uniref:gluconate 2-dehydrogenase subunit 3 family protein n=1 Tax=Sphingobium sp. BYY-5 TaxID=2926400 RepID=UPI001FA775FD|nr:gluconate 2-dehydrogenase subunit 3 family protein [Sphingobium sp. BYY-5]MCI4591681.1 gluconate 2-dehydrogenase subunit 3 family protein [Sphingobium sp. BYY-5]
MIDRRKALAGMVAMFGAQLFAPIARAAGIIPAQAVISEGTPSIQVFTPDQRALMTALCDRIIPATDTPGAISAGVPAYIEKLLADWADPDDQGPIISGLAEIDARSQHDYNVPAHRATAAQQDALLTLAMNNGFQKGAEFFEAFRQLVIVGYYTSEIGITQEREYLPVPGEYNGAFPYSQVNKVYSA